MNDELSQTCWECRRDPCRCAALAAPKEAGDAFERAMKASWEMVDPRDSSAPGSYYKGHNNGVIAALQTVRANYDIERSRLAAPSKEAGVDIDAMVNRFLCWKLPQDFHPDAGISFTPYDPPEHPHMRDLCWPVGTNLLTADQARAMFTHCLATPCPIDGLTEPHVGMDPPHQYTANPPGDQRQEGGRCKECNASPCECPSGWGPKPASPPPEAAATVGESRFFIDHGVVHDRKTGKHVRGCACIAMESSADDLLTLLRSLEFAALASPTGVDDTWFGPDASGGWYIKHGELFFYARPQKMLSPAEFAGLAARDGGA